LNIFGFGRVADDVEFLGQGAIFVNPQHAGSGLKLKSAIAMAAGKTLVSTSNGCLGIPVLHGRQAIVSDDAESMAQHIDRLIRNPISAVTLADEGREFVSRFYGAEAFSANSRAAVLGFAALRASIES
jgi:glycosyltransferase involved in cell wall biosynthesis